MTHVDGFIDDSLKNSREERYARWMFMHFRLPAHGMEFLEFLDGKKLFCTYEGERWRVNGASRFGHIFLTKDFGADAGYQNTADLAHCKDWSPEP